MAGPTPRSIWIGQIVLGLLNEEGHTYLGGGWGQEGVRGRSWELKYDQNAYILRELINIILKCLMKPRSNIIIKY